MAWFRKKKQGSGTIVYPTRDKIAKTIAKGISIVQTRWAVWMTKKMAALSLRSQKVVFVIWAVIMLLSCSYIMVSSLYENPQEKKAKREMKMPRLRLQEPAAGSIVISDRMYQKLQAFKSKMDSLGRTGKGNTIRDSLLKTRPGLMDSIKMVEKLYGQSIK